MLTHSSVWIFNQMRYNGLYKRIYDLYLLGVVYFTCIRISIPIVPVYMNNNNNFQRIPDFYDCHLDWDWKPYLGEYFKTMNWPNPTVTHWKKMEKNRH